MTKIEFHPKAKEHFDEKANALLLELSPLNLKKEQHTFTPNFIPAATLTDEDLVGNPVFTSGGDNKFFIHEKRQIGFSGNSYRQFVQLTDHIFRSPSCRDKVSHKMVESILFRWAEDKYFGRSILSATDYLMSDLERIIKPATVYVPIAATAVESEFRIGRVLILPLKGETIDSWQKDFGSNSEEMKLQVKELFDRKRLKLQGYAIGLLQIEAEPSHASSVAIEEVERALSLLRVFSPVNASIAHAS